jgi:uncharacterized protein (UPF0218 family)
VPGDVVVELPKALRSELKDPLGPIYTDAEALLSDASGPLIAVGDIVTYHLLAAGTTPAVALVDERTERTAVDEDVREAVLGGDGTAFDRTVTVDNPAATLTAGLLDALVEAIEQGASTLLVVEGEEDLAALPAVLAAPEGATVVYGQPGEGMVRVTVDADTRERARSLLSRMDGDPDALFDALGA